MVATPHRICPEGRCVLSTAQSERVAGSPRRRVQRITNRMLGMGKIVTVHVQASSFTYLVQATRANNAPHIAWQRSSPSRASFLLSFGPFVEEAWSARDPRVSRVPTTKGSKDNEQDARDGEDRNRARPSIIVHVPGVGHAREQRTLYSVAAMFPIPCVLFVILCPFVEEAWSARDQLSQRPAGSARRGIVFCRPLKVRAQPSPHDEGFKG